MELSIIIVSYNVKDLLIDCIESINRFFEDISYEIIVVDNNSDDGTIDDVCLRFPQVVFIQNRHNTGFSAANNQGIKISKGDFILLLNPDTYFIDNSVKRMLDYIKSQGDNVIMSPRLLNADRSLQVSAWKDKTILVMTMELIRIFIDRYQLRSFTTPMQIDNVAGAAMLFPKTVVNNIGFLDDDIFWMEDFDFCYRLRKGGGKVMYFPGASIVHYGGGSTDRNLNIAYANANISKLKFYKKNFSFVSALLASLVILAHILSRLFFFMLLSPFHSMFRKWVKAYIYTIKKYFRFIFLDDGALV